VLLLLLLLLLHDLYSANFEDRVRGADRNLWVAAAAAIGDDDDDEVDEDNVLCGLHHRGNTGPAEPLLRTKPLHIWPPLISL